MNDIISNYIIASKNNIINIVDVLEDNIEFLENNLWSSKEEFKEIINNVISIYYDKYYLYTENNFEKIDNYIKFTNKINRKLKTILLSIIDYYESIDNTKIIEEKEGSILYLTILIYLSLILYNTNFNIINNPKGIEKVINNILDNFAKIRFKKNKDLDNIINKIKESVEKNNLFRKYIDNISTKESHNSYINLSKDSDYYKVLYEYDIDALDDYDGKDIRIVIDKLNIYKKFMVMTFDLCYFTVFKLLEQGLDYKFLIPVVKDKLDDETLDAMLAYGNEKVLKNIKLIIDYEEVQGNYEFVNHVRSKNIDLAIEVTKNFESDNYNMFLSVNTIVVEEEFLSLNDKYIEIWKDMEISFIVKDMSKKISEKELISNR